MAAYAMAKAAKIKPMVIRVMGRNGIPILRRAGYTRRSTMGMKMMIVMESIFCMISLGMP